MSFLTSLGRHKGRTAAVVVAVPVAGFVAAYLLFFRGSNVAPLAVSQALTTHAPVAATTVSGTWTVASNSTAGYRVREQLGFAPAQSDAVGRTSAITGQATLTSAANVVTVAAAAFKVDVTQLSSDDQRRDNRIRGIGLETDSFPTASFKLTAPIALPTAALTGAAVPIQVTGDLALHGVTKSETISMTVEQSESSLEFVGSLSFAWGDFGMTAPNVGGFVTIEGNATMQFQIVLQKG